MKRNLLMMILVLSMLLAACGSSGTADKQGEKTQKDSGTVQGTENQTEPEKETENENEGQVIGGVRVVEHGTITEEFRYYNGDLLVRQVNEQIQLLDMNGNETADKLYDEVNALVGEGIVIVGMDSTDTPKLGVVNAYTGEELVPCEAVDIQKLNDRYLLINYYTGAATQENHYDTYIDDEIVYFNGYGNVLDLQEQRIVPNLKVTDDVYAAGNMLYADIDNKTTEVFDANGKSAGTFEYLYAYPDSDLGIRVGPTGFFVYDKDFREVGYVTGDVYDFDPIDGVDHLLEHTFVENQETWVQLVDLNGNVVLETSYKQMDAFFESGFEAREEENGPWGFVAMDGTVLVPFEYKYVTVVEPGYIFAEKEDGVCDVYNLSGEKLNTSRLDGADQCAFYIEGGFFAPETGEFVKATNMDYLGYGLINVQDTSYTSTIYSTLTGEVVFDEVESYIFTGSHLYIWDGKTEIYTHYELQWA